MKVFKDYQDLNINPHVIDFPPGLSEEVRLRVCKILDEKDKQIQQVESKFDSLEHKLGEFNGGLTWRQAEDLHTQMGINNAKVDQIMAGLKKFNLRVVEYEDCKSPHRFPIRLEKIGILERISTFLKFFIKFRIVLKS